MPSRGLPLSSVITGTIVTLIAATTVAVAAAGWRASERTVDMLWRELAVNVATVAWGSWSYFGRYYWSEPSLDVRQAVELPQ